MTTVKTCLGQKPTRLITVSPQDPVQRALEQMNRETRARLRARRLREASEKVRAESMRVNAEFDRIERDVDA